MGAEIALLLSVGLIVYTYIGYPVIISGLSRLLERRVRRADIEPSISVIIAAHNEEQDIAAKIENTLELDYPKAKLQIIVVSDCSADRTDEIVRGYQDRGVILLRQNERLGKSAAQNRAVRISTGDVLVFSDATTMYAHDTLRKIVSSFADSEVGCVAGQLVYVEKASSAVIGRGCRSYWSYEKFLKRSESRLGSLIGVSGCLYAVRRSSCSRIAAEMSSDFVIASEIHLQGLRTVYDERAISFEATNKNGRDEFRMRVRVIEQTFSAISRYSELLSLRKHGFFAFQLISHKILRYAAPIFLVGAFVSNLLAMSSSEFYRATFFAQAFFYVLALAGWYCDRASLKIGVLALPYYFVLANLASVGGLLKFLRGEAHLIWEPLREVKVR